MSQNPEDWWHDEYYEALAREELVAEKLKAISEEGIRSYLGTHGDAVESRVGQCLSQAKYLSDQGYPAAAVMVSVTAIELTVRYMLVRPLIQGAFLSDDWAQLLARRMTTGRGAQDRDMLPNILEFRGIKINELKLSNGADLWSAITGSVVEKRNRIVHEGESAKADDGKLALECATLLWSDVVLPMAKGLGFTLEETGCWHRIARSEQDDHTPVSPFKS